MQFGTGDMQSDIQELVKQYGADSDPSETIKRQKEKIIDYREKERAYKKHIKLYRSLSIALLVVLVIFMICTFTMCSKLNKSNTTIDNLHNSINDLTQINNGNFSKYESNTTVYITKGENGEKYHRKNCIYVKNNSPVSLSKNTAKNMGKTPCSICKPDEH